MEVDLFLTIMSFSSSKEGKVHHSDFTNQSGEPSKRKLLVQSYTAPEGKF